MIDSAGPNGPNSARDEKLLVSRARLGDSDALSQLILAVSPRLFDAALRLVHDRAAAEDVVQEALWRAFQHLAGYRGEAAFSTWLTRITINEGLKLLKRRKVEPRDLAGAGARPLEAHSWSSPRPSPEQICADREMARLTHHWIDGIAPAYRTVLRLRVFDELTYEEIADLQRLPVSSVKTRIHRARRALMSRARQRNRQGTELARPAFTTHRAIVERRP